MSLTGRKTPPLRLHSLACCGAIAGVVSAALVGCNLPLDPGPPPRPTVIMITAEGPYFTGFDDPGDWLTAETETSGGRVESGTYILSIKKSDTLAWTNQTREFGYGIYELDARFLSGPEASAYGLLILGTSDMSSFVYVMITDDGRYDIGTCKDWCGIQESLIGGLTLSYSIQPGEQSNHLRVELSETGLSLAINGAPVSQLSGITATKGLVGFIGESSQYGGFEAAFDNLQVTEAGGPESVEPPPTLFTATPPLETTAPALIEPTP